MYVLEAQQAVAYVKEKLPDGSNNRISDIWGSHGRSLTCVAGEKAAEMIMQKQLDQMHIMKKIRTIATMAENRECGNCGEQVCVAFVFLYDRKVRPIDFMQFDNGDHGFIVLGREEGAVKVADWGRNAYIADPWLGKSYAASMLGAIWPGKLPALTFRAA